MKINAVLFDLDDTLLRDDRTISDYTIRVLRNAAAKGIRVIPASGRARDSMRPFVEQIGCATCYIACNGAEIWSVRHEPVRMTRFDCETALRILDFAKARNCYCQTYSENNFYYNQKGFWADSYAKSSMLIGYHVEDLSLFVSEHPTCKLLFMAEEKQIAENLRDARVLFDGKASVTCSKPYFLEFNPVGATKGEALKQCAKLFGFSPEHTLAFGDSLNDLSMLREAGMGVCVANARDDVKRIIKNTCETNQDDGPAKFLASFL